MIASGRSVFAAMLFATALASFAPAQAGSIKDVEPLGAAAAKLGLTAADVAKIRGAYGGLTCRTRGGGSRTVNAWLINSGTQILTILHAFIDEKGRVQAEPSGCYFTPASDPKRRIGINTLAISSNTNYLYLRKREGRAPELVEEREYLGDRPSLDLEILKGEVWGGAYFSRYAQEDYFVLDLKRPAEPLTSLEFGDISVFPDHESVLFLASRVSPSLERKIRSDRLMVQNCSGYVDALSQAHPSKPMYIRTNCWGEPGVSGGIFFRKQGERLVAIAIAVSGIGVGTVRTNVDWSRTDIDTFGIVADRKFTSSLPQRNFFSPR